MIHYNFLYWQFKVLKIECKKIQWHGVINDNLAILRHQVFSQTILRLRRDSYSFTSHLVVWCRRKQRIGEIWSVKHKLWNDEFKNFLGYENLSTTSFNIFRFSVARFKLDRWITRWLKIVITDHRFMCLVVGHCDIQTNNIWSHQRLPNIHALQFCGH